MRQITLTAIITARTEFACVVAENLALAFDVVDEADLLVDKLRDPDRHCATPGPLRSWVRIAARIRLAPSPGTMR